MPRCVCQAKRCIIQAAGRSIHDRSRGVTFRQALSPEQHGVVIYPWQGSSGNRNERSGLPLPLRTLDSAFTYPRAGLVRRGLVNTYTSGIAN